MPVVLVNIVAHSYLGLCEFGAGVSALPFTIYQEIMNDISPAEIEDIDITPLEIVRDVEVLCGKIKYPTDFLVLGSSQDDFCPIMVDIS